MARDPIQELQDRVKEQFTMFASIALVRANRFFEYVDMPEEDLIQFSDDVPNQCGQASIVFYDTVQGERGLELPAVILFPAKVMHGLKALKSTEYADLLTYMDGVQQKLTRNTGGQHARVYDLDYGDRYHNNVGIGVNLLVSQKTVSRLNQLSAAFLSY